MKQLLVLILVTLSVHAIDAQQATVRQRHPITKINVTLLTGLALMVAPQLQAQESPLLSAYEACRKTCLVPYERSVNSFFGWTRELYEKFCLEKLSPEYCMTTQVIPYIASLEERLAELEKEKKV